ncbi:TTF-type domain-containing protein [Heracleum sosnowskyi]|uniref:TTF-type domain-containing protein n=1 Tax=Heracleum sosnowskyi TaxID=360622 RepID=A0AAD8HBU2_9APIA|nr:TTF-type domain-containing protein [Heracleum sosnowskyi]
MEIYFPKRKIDDVVNQEPQSENRTSASVCPRVETNLDDLPIDPGKRKNIYTIDDNDRERVRRFYLQKGPFQPKMIFPKRQCGERDRRFVSTWFNDHPSWLEYSVSEDSCYCLFCYLFKPEHGGQSDGDVFVTKGFINQKEAVKKFRDHVGDINSIHHKCIRACQDLMYEKQHIEIVISNQSEQTQIDYCIRLVASVDVAKLCLIQALAFRGHMSQRILQRKVI